MNRATLNHIAIIAVVSFTLHLVWENAQAPLYTCFWQDWIGCLGACLRATFGDVAITLAVWGVVATVARNGQWDNTMHAPGLAGLALAGTLIAVGIERHALALGRWSYTSVMPMVPYLSVGVTPVLQMAVLLPLTLLISRKLTVLIV